MHDRGGRSDLQRIESDPLGLLNHLVDKSLVIVGHQGENVRCRLHETVRQYGRERLEDVAETDTIRTKHSGYFLELAERAEVQLQGSAQPAWLDRLEVNHDNIRAAFDCSRSRSDIDKSMRMACALWRFWEVRGYLTEGREWFKYTLEVRSGALPSIRARALDGDGRLAWRQTDYQGPRERFEESLALWRSIGDKAGEANAFNGLARAALNVGDCVQAWAEASLAASRALGASRVLRPGGDGL